MLYTSNVNVRNKLANPEIMSATLSEVELESIYKTGWLRASSPAIEL